MTVAQAMQINDEITIYDVFKFTFENIPSKLTPENPQTKKKWSNTLLWPRSSCVVQLLNKQQLGESDL